MRRSSLRGKVLLGFVLVVVAGLGAVAWLERQTLLTWFYLHNLSQAGEADREAWAARVAGLDEAAVPGLLGCLGRDEPRACGNACLALDRLGQRWRDHGTRWPDLAARLVEAFPRCSGTGQQELLRLMGTWLASHEGEQVAPAELSTLL